MLIVIASDYKSKENKESFLSYFFQKSTTMKSKIDKLWKGNLNRSVFIGATPPDTYSTHWRKTFIRQRMKQGFNRAKEHKSAKDKRKRSYRSEKLNWILGECPLRPRQSTWSTFWNRTTTVVTRRLDADVHDPWRSLRRRPRRIVRRPHRSRWRFRRCCC